MKKINKLISIFLIVAVCITLTACATQKSASYNEIPSARPSAEATAPQVMNDMGETGGVIYGEKTQENVGIMPIMQEGRKIIYEANVNIETLEFDKSTADLLEAAQKLGGYVSATSLNANKWQDSASSAAYTLKIPSENYTDFMNGLSSTGNVTYKSETTQDITSEYVDVQARLKSLNAQETRLMDMLVNAGELETLLAIQNQLAEVQYKIESYTAQMRTFDGQVAYSTIEINLQEVKHITQEKDTFFKRIGAAFQDSIINLIYGVQNLIIAVIYYLPTIIILAILAICGFILFKKTKKKMKISKAEVKTSDEEIKK